MGNQASYSVGQDPENINLVNMNLSELPFIPLMEQEAQHLYLSRNKLTSLPENLEEVSSVDLSKNKMGPSLPNNIAKALSTYKSLRTLVLASNQLKDLTKLLKNDKIETFNLSTNQFDKFPEHFVENFPKVKSFYFSCNFLKTFSNFHSELINSLSLSLNCIETIDISTINLPQLQKLDLSKNKINQLPNNLSKSFPQLNSLDLSDNFISELPENESDDTVFPETLQELNLMNNSIEKITNSITNLPNLTVLIISNNKIKEIPTLNQSLTKFDASKNQIDTISKQTLKNIKELFLSENKIEKFPLNIKTKIIETIILHHNNIDEINLKNITIRSYLPKTIKMIDLSFNHIEEIPKELFESLPNIESFSASFNQIRIIPQEIVNCNKITYLEISSNPIKTLPKLPLSLETIAASNCQIESLEDVFVEQKTRSRYYSTATKRVKNIPLNDDDNQAISISQSHLTVSGLRHADFSENCLSEFPTISDLQILNLSHNHIKKFPSISSQTRILDVSMNEIDEIPAVINAPFIVELNISFNKLKKVPKFQKMSHLKYLEMAGNRFTGSLDISEMKVIDVIDISQTDISTVTSENPITTEIITSKKDLKILSKNKPLKKKPLYVNQKIQNLIGHSGFTEILGLRDSMEDSIILREDLGLFAVSDGHGGSDTSRFITSKLVQEFESQLQNEKKDKGKNKKTRKDQISIIFKETTKSLKKRNFSDGSTIVLCHLYQGENKRRNLITAHLGDARALIVKSDGSARELTKDHKPFMRNEFERVHKIFGTISNENRVDGILAVSKTMGDNFVFGVGHEPELNEFVIDDENDKFLVICCDGVFDVLSNDEVAKIVSSSESANEAAFKIRNVAFGIRSLDNISVIVVDLMNNNT